MGYHHGNLRESLIQAGDEELKTKGAENISLREIAKRAGVSHNAPYRHFSHKAELIDSIVERSLLELADQILAGPLLYPVSLLMQVQYVGRLWAMMATRHPRKAHLIFTGLSQTAERKNTIKAGHDLLRANLSSLLDSARGQELPLDIDVQKLSLILIATFRGLGVLYTSQSASDLLPSEDELYDIVDLATEIYLALGICIK